MELSLAALPLAAGVAEVASALGQDPGAFAIQAGEDYELCFTVPPEARAAAESALEGLNDARPAVSWIGKVVSGEPSEVRFDAGSQQLAGYQHQL